MSLSNREGGGGRQTVSQETCQLWYGDDEFQITRFDCTELTFRFKECMYPLRKSILYNPAAYYMIRVGFLSLWPEHTRAVACGRKAIFMLFCRPRQGDFRCSTTLYFKEDKSHEKKIVALLCTVAMTCTLLAGCGQSAADTTAGTFETEDSTEVETDAVSDQEAANNVAALIDAIYVQERTDETDAQCTAAKEAWDALTDVQKELVAGEFADPDYFGRDTGDALSMIRAIRMRSERMRFWL